MFGKFLSSPLPERIFLIEPHQSGWMSVRVFVDGDKRKKSHADFGFFSLGTTMFSCVFPTCFDWSPPSSSTIQPPFPPTLLPVRCRGNPPTSRGCVLLNIPLFASEECLIGEVQQLSIDLTCVVGGPISASAHTTALLYAFDLLGFYVMLLFCFGKGNWHLFLSVTVKVQSSSKKTYQNGPGVGFCLSANYHQQKHWQMWGNDLMSGREAS